MTEPELLERIEAQAAEIERLNAQLAQAVETAEKIAELEGKETQLQDENDALRRAVSEQNEIIENMTAPIRDVADRLDSITKAAGTVDASAIEGINERLSALTAAATQTEEKMRAIPTAMAAHWAITAACIIITAAGVWYSATCAQKAERAATGAQEAATAAYWGIYTPPDERGETHSAIEWSASWQKWQNSAK